MADKRISQLIERTDIANNDVLPIVASGATTTNKVTISTIQTWMQDNLDVGVTSVGLSMPSAFVVSNSPVTASGNITVTGAGTVSQYIRGDGSLADFPQSAGGGGASVSYYLNGSVSQGTIGGVAYLEMNKTPILGAGTDFTIAADGYIASFITDAGDPGLLEIPAGNWNFETYIQASSGGGSPTFYIELYKVNSGGTATLIASNSGTPESISLGTNINPYFSALAVPQTTLALTDRLALRYYVTHAGRTITLHTENNTLCQIITTFTTGLTALNGLTAQVQNFATGTSGTDFNISSAGSTHTFNIPSASATARGLVTTGSQTIAGAKTFSDDAVINGVSVGRGASSVATNTRLGFQTLVFNTTGSSNTSVGWSSLYLNTTGSANSSFGTLSLENNTTGTGNTAIGYVALRNNTTGGSNTATGYLALNANTTGNANTATGAYALENNTTGSNNTAVGQEALENNIVGTFNTAIGFQALKENTNSSNTAIGYLASSKNTSGSSNFSGGARALENTTTGSVNTSIGFASLQQNTTGGGNVAIGEDAGRYTSVTSVGNTNGNDSVFIGRQSKPLGDSQTNQIVIGHLAVGNGSNTVTLGNDSITTTFLKGNISLKGENSAVKSIQYTNPSGTLHWSVQTSFGSAGEHQPFSIRNGVLGTDAILIQPASNNITLNNSITNLLGSLSGTTATFSGTVRPTTNMIADLGSGSIRWSTLFGRNIDLTEGAIIGGALTGTSATFAGRARFQGTGYDTLGSAEIMLTNTTASTGRSFIVNSSNAGEFLISDVSAGQTRLSINSSGAVTFTGNLTANSFIKTGGTSSQFLKADGSVDSSTYLTTGTAASTYLPLIGGVLTGGLGGTSASFSGDVQTSTRLVAANPSATITITPNLSGTTNRIEASNLPLEVYTSGSELKFRAGTGNAQVTLASTGAVTLTGALNGTSASFTGAVTSTGTGLNPSLRLTNTTASTGTDWHLYSLNNGNFGIYNNTAGAYSLQIASTGAATFSSSVTAAGGFEIPNGQFYRARRTSGNLLTDMIGIPSGTNDVRIVTTGAFQVVSGGLTTFLNIADTGAATFSSSVNVGGTSSNTDFRIYRTVDAGAYLSISAPGGSPLTSIIGISGTNVMSLNQSGNVGIGTSTPYALLSVYSGTAGDRILIDSSTGSGSNGSIAWGAGGTPNISARIKGTDDGFFGTNLIFETRGFSGPATNTIERMRVTSGGFLKASNTGSYSSTTSSVHEIRSNVAGGALLVSNSNTSNPYGLAIVYTVSPNNNAEFFIECADSSATRFIVRSNGNVSNTNGSYGAISDIKLKENIQDATPKLDDLMKVKVRNYNLIGEETKQIGVIAQELEEVFPAMIEENPDFEEVEVPQVDKEGNEVLNEEGEVVTSKEKVSKGTTTKSVKYSVFVPMLIKAMQEQQEQIKSLTEQVEALKSQING